MDFAQALVTTLTEEGLVLGDDGIWRRERDGASFAPETLRADLAHAQQALQAGVLRAIRRGAPG